MIFQRGGFVLGMVAGLLVGLALALGVALYITKAPIPFINKVPNRTAEQDTAEAERNRHWDPNAPLGARTPARPASAAAVVVATPAPAPAPAAASPAPKSNKDPAAILAGGALPTRAPAPIVAPNAAPKSTAPGADAFVYFLQIGAYTNAEEAEQQRAKLALSGLVARVTEREQAGRTVYRVRLGPFDKRDEADALQSRLTETNVESRLVRVERS